MAKELARQVEVVNNDSGNVMPIRLTHPTTGRMTDLDDRGNLIINVLPYDYRADNGYFVSKKLLTIVGSATSNGTSADFLYPNFAKDFTLYVRRTAGTTDVVDVRLEGFVGTVGGTNRYVQLAQITSVAGGEAVVFVVDKPVIGCRVNIVNIGTGNTLDYGAIAMRV